jgi:choline dehydrogenase-like flavoprotein
VRVVVCGAGTAGCVVAARLSQDPALEVTLHPEHYDEWDALVDGYAWESWLPWFREIEADRDFPQAPWHGDAGPIPISRYPRPGWLELQERFCEAALALGHEWVDDHNAPGAPASARSPSTWSTGCARPPPTTTSTRPWRGPT